MNVSIIRKPTSLGGCATLACLWEATAAKPGNVHRGADFADMSYVDFVTSAAVVGPVFDLCTERGLGGTVLEAVRTTKQAVEVNTNLGTLLLLAPLALAEGDAPLAGKLVAEATAQDTANIYEAIRIASPGGLGKVEQGDVAQAPKHSLLEAMQLAADRDLVARQLANEFCEVAEVAGDIETKTHRGYALNDAIVRAALRLLSNHPDSLIARKCGEQVAGDVARRASDVLSAVDQPAYYAALADFDFWLRADGNRRNPGTTADLIAAALFVLLVQDRISWPIRFYSSDGAA